MQEVEQLEWEFLVSDGGLSEALARADQGTTDLTRSIEAQGSAMEATQQSASSLADHIRLAADASSQAVTTMDDLESSVSNTAAAFGDQGLASNMGEAGLASSELAVDATNAGVALHGAGDSAAELGDHANNAGTAMHGAGEHATGLAATLTHLRGETKQFAAEIGEKLPEGARMGIEGLLKLDSSIGFVTESFTAFANPAGIAVAALAAIVATGALAVGTLYEMAQGAAELGDKLYLQNAKTGISIDNLHTLGVVADIAGTSSERMVMAMTMLQYRMERAGNATKGAGKALRDLHLDTNDANHALEQMVDHLSSIENPAKRTAEAMKLMGPRMGRDFGVLAGEVKAMGGTFEEVKEKLEALGIEMSGAEVQAAHQLTKETKLLEAQWESLKFAVESAAVPIVLEWLKDVSKWLAKNKGDIVEWGHTFVETLDGVVNSLAAVASGLRIVNAIMSVGLSEAIPAVYDTVRAPTPIERTNSALAGSAYSNLSTMESRGGPRLPSIGGRLGNPADWKDNPSAYELAAPSLSAPYESKEEKHAPPKIGGKGGKGTGEDWNQIQMKLEQEALKQVLASYKDQEDGWSFMLKRKQISLESYTALAVGIEKHRSSDTLAVLADEMRLADTIKKPGARLEKELEIRGKIDAENRRHADVNANYNQAVRDKDEEGHKIVEEGKLAISEMVGRQHQASIQDLAQHRVITEESAADQIAAIDIDLLQKKHANLITERNKYVEGSNERRKINVEIAKLETQEASTSEENARKKIAARERDLANLKQFYASMISMSVQTQQSMLSTQQANLQHQIDLGNMPDANQQRRELQAIDAERERISQEQQVREAQARTREAIKPIDTALGTAGITIAQERRLDAEKKSIIAQSNAEIEAMEQDHKSRMQEINERALVEMHRANQQLAATLTQDLNTAIADGFSHGMKAGIRTFGQGILQIVQSRATAGIEQQLTHVFDNIGKGGGIFSKILGAATGVKIDPTEVAHTTALTVITPIMGAHTVALDVMVPTMVAHTAALLAFIANQQAQQAETFINTLVSGAANGASAGAAAEGGFFQATPGGQNIKLAEGGFDEVVLSTDPSQHARMNSLLNDYSTRTGLAPSMNSGGGGKVVNINQTINVPVLGGSSHSAPRSKREYGEMIASAMQSAMGDM